MLHLHIYRLHSYNKWLTYSSTSLLLPHQPYCDGSHKRTEFTPVKFSVAEEQPEAFLCGCKQTCSQPYCDGTHATALVQEAQVDTS